MPKIATRIVGFDHIAMGGLPAQRMTLVVGTSGSAKTVFGAQFLAQGAQDDNDPGVFVTFEESAARLRQNLRSFGWDIQAWEERGLWAFEDFSAVLTDNTPLSGSYDLGPVLVRIEAAVKATGARRVCVDSVGVLWSRFSDPAAIRNLLFRIADRMSALGVTTVVTAERTEEYGPISRHGVEEFVADNVVVLRNSLEEQRRRRTIEILKFRGADHLKGEFPFTLVAPDGIVVLPLSAMELSQRSSSRRVTSGIENLDAMCGDGFFEHSIVLISGATGTGKTMVASTFLAASLRAGGRSVLFGYEESPAQFHQHAESWGQPLRPHEASGQLLITCQYPEVRSLEDHLLLIKRTVDSFQPASVVIDSLSSLERIGTVRAFREFVVGLTSYLKQQGVTTLITATTPELTGGTSITESNIFTITDTIVVLRYVEVAGDIRRGVAVLKMRGCLHDSAIREYRITGEGMRIGEPIRDVSGILLGPGQKQLHLAGQDGR